MQGTLESFGVVDLLQLLGRTRLSGTLHIECPRRVVDVRFVRGDIAETRDSSRVTRGATLGDELLAAGLVAPEVLADALTEQERSSCLLGALLVDRGALSEAAMRERLSRQAANTLVAGRLEAYGEFYFLVDHDPAERRVVLLPIHEVLMEMAVLGGEYVQAVEALGHYDVVLEPRQGEFVEGETPAAGAKVQQTLLDLVDGRRTAREVVDEAGLEELVAIAGLGHLIDSEAISVVSDEPLAALDAVLTDGRQKILGEVEQIALGMR